MCYGTICDYSIEERSLTKNAHRKEENPNSTMSQDDVTAQKSKIIEFSTMLEQAESGVVAEVAATHNLGEEENVAAAYNPGEDANAAPTKGESKVNRRYAEVSKQQK